MIVVHWPNGTTQTIFEPPMSQVTELTEPSDAVFCGNVPDGDDVPGTPLRLARAGDEITLIWSASCVASDSDYAIYEGTLGDFGSHESRFCTTGGETVKTFAPADGDSYYLVVPGNSVWEGSYSTGSDGNERAPSSSACLEQRIEVCGVE